MSVRTAVSRLLGLFAVGLVAGFVAPVLVEGGAAAG